MKKIATIILTITVLVIISGCVQKNTLQNKEQPDDLECINEPGQAYYPGTEKCCKDLKPVFPYELPDGTCISSENDNRGGMPVCAPCGNNICEKEYSEDKCNCPEDCS